MTEREARPYVSTHNLAKPPKLAAPLPAGDEVEALHRGSHKTRVSRYRRAIRILEALIADDLALEARIRLAADAPLPSGGAEGSRSSDISDPSGNTATTWVQQRRIKDAAERTWDSAANALHALWWASKHHSSALRLLEADSPEAKQRFQAAVKQLFDREEVELVETGCTNCAKIGEYAKRGEPKHVPKGSTLCTWCHQFEQAHGVLPPRSLLRIHHGPKGKVTTRDVEKALPGWRPQKPHQ